jgi:hypothetical protein
MATLRMSLAQPAGKPCIRGQSGAEREIRSNNRFTKNVLADSFAGSLAAPEGLLEAFIAAVGRKMHVERIAREVHRDCVVGGNIDSREARRTDPLHRDLVFLNRQIMLVSLFEDIQANIIVCLLQVRSIHHRDGLKIILKAEIRHQGRSDFEQRYSCCNHDKNAKYSFDHRPEI